MTPAQAAPLSTKQIAGTTIDEIARRLEPRTRRIFLEAIEALKADLSLAAIEEALRTGSIFEVAEAMGLQRLTEELKPLGAVLTDALLAGGVIAMEVASSQINIPIKFDITDERALAFVREHGGELIREVSEETRQAIMAQIQEEFTVGRSPPAAARRLRRRLGLTRHQRQIVANYEETLRAAVRGEATWADVNRFRLNPIRGPGGVVQERIESAVARYEERMVAFRADSIAQTETLTAANQGQREAWRQLVDSGHVSVGQMREWLTAEDERVCPLCAPLDGITVGVNEQFPLGGDDGPPRHIRCRCSERLIFP